MKTDDLGGSPILEQWVSPWFDRLPMTVASPTKNSDPRAANSCGVTSWQMPTLQDGGCWWSLCIYLGDSMGVPQELVDLWHAWYSKVKNGWQLEVGQGNSHFKGFIATWGYGSNQHVLALLKCRRFNIDGHLSLWFIGTSILRVRGTLSKKRVTSLIGLDGFMLKVWPEKPFAMTNLGIPRRSPEKSGSWAKLKSATFRVPLFAGLLDIRLNSKAQGEASMMAIQ